MSRPLRGDASLSKSIALPNGANTVNSAAIDLGIRSTRDDNLGDAELLITAPALATTPLPDTKTMTYSVIHDDDSDLSDGTILAPGVLVQTGAAGAGAAAATFRFKPPTDAKRYIGLRAVNSGTGDASGSDGTIALLL